ncbi:MAG: YeeE/YedE thiosulfate transporter family protein [Thaumarchaeota archaeon]|nr:YeeE/YedE thiosulfate transporter family protein [Candidatus Calditenuaceae archaeon]MDW8187470.1 YeeE/YedE thiosulfate transporter family protein [Nitrososphaerota archaeon]
MSRNVYVSAALIGVVSVVLGYSAYVVAGRGSTWGITTGESKLGGLFWKSLGLPVEQLTYYQQFKLLSPFADPTQAIVFGVLVGGLSAALVTRSFVLKHFPNKWMVLQAVLGGFLLGYGARLGFGCNIGNFLSGWAAGGVHAAVFTAALLPGTYLGLKATERFFIVRAAPKKLAFTVPISAQRWFGISAAVAALAVAPLLEPLVAVWWVAGTAFGALGWFSNICFASCYRDMVARRYASGVMVKAIAIVLITYSTGIFLLQIAGVPFALRPPQIGVLQLLLGGLVFGLGIGIAGSCIFSTEWRAGGGSVYSMLVLLSTIVIGMPALSLHYDWWLSILPQEPKPFTLYALGPIFGYLAPLSFSIALLLYGVYADPTTRYALFSRLGTKFFSRPRPAT